MRRGSCHARWHILAQRLTRSHIPPRSGHLCLRLPPLLADALRSASLSVRVAPAEPVVDAPQPPPSRGSRKRRDRVWTKTCRSARWCRRSWRRSRRDLHGQRRDEPGIAGTSPLELRRPDGVGAQVRAQQRVGDEDGRRQSRAGDGQESRTARRCGRPRLLDVGWGSSHSGSPGRTFVLSALTRFERRTIN